MSLNSSDCYKQVKKVVEEDLNLSKENILDVIKEKAESEVDRDPLLLDNIQECVKGTIWYMIPSPIKFREIIYNTTVSEIKKMFLSRLKIIYSPQEGKKGALK